MKPQTKSSLWQLLNSIVPFCGLIYLMYLSLALSYWITLGLAVLAAGFMVRIFIIQHDCGHGSFFRSRKTNNRIGVLCSLFTMVPYYYWRRQHALHHASNGNLDRRGHGDVDVFTVEEYLRLSQWGRLKYRIYRHPLGFLLFGPLALFLIVNRLPYDRRQSSKRERRNVYWTDLAIIIVFFAFGWWIGSGNLFLIAGPVFYFAGAIGIWLFYVQHQFEHAYWKREGEWDHTRAAIQGSSFFKLPKLLQWFTGNIGFHHIHHLNENIPNYRLRQLYDETPEYRDARLITLRTSIKAMFLSVWDEPQERLISFREMMHSIRRTNDLSLGEE
ncbi:MAG: fatty acid desaturase [Calditrichota bacterium]